MQNPIPGNPLAGIPQVNNKDPIPFFLKIIVTIILGLATLCIIHPDTRKTLANLPNDVFYKGQVWRLFTTEFITFSAIDCLFAMFLAYASIGKFQKRVGSVVFIIDFILVGLLMSALCSVLGLLLNLATNDSLAEVHLKHNSGFLGMYFFYSSRFHFLDPEREILFCCFVIRQKSFPSILFLILMLLTSFRVPLIISTAYCLVMLESNLCRGRFFKFSFYFYLRAQKMLRWVSKRDDFYKVEECGDSLTFFNNVHDLGLLYNQGQDLFRNLQQDLPPQQPNQRMEEPQQPRVDNQNHIEPPASFVSNQSAQELERQKRLQEFHV